MPIAPAPMNLTCVLQTASVCAASGTPAAAGCIAVRIGTATPHAMIRPTSIAIPTESPTRWPAPSSASDQATSYPLDAPPPILKNPVTSAAAMRVAVRMANPPDAAEPRMIARRPSRASPVSSFTSPRAPEPTLSTSAAATPSG